MNYSTLSPHQTLQEFSSSPEGLSTEEAARRLKRYGTNTLPQTRLHSLWQILLGPFRSLFVLVLLLAMVISLFTGHVLDAVVIALVVLFEAAVEWSQQLSAINVLAALERYDLKTCRVMRDGQPRELAVSELVPGDVVLLAEGDTVPADGRLVEVNALAINEAILTGESSAAEKTSGPLRGRRPITDQTNMVWRGTAVTAGQGKACITATGATTEFARIAHLSQSLGNPAPIQVKIDELVKKTLIIVAAIAAITLVIGLYRGYEAAEMFRITLALCVSAIPEGLPIALTIILLLSIKQMARSKALVRTLPTVETLGMVTLIAADKTGTLTLNQLEVAERRPLKSAAELDAAVAMCFDQQDVGLDQINIALSRLQLPAPPGYEPVKVIPFQAKSRLSGMVWQRQKKYVLIVKGAPESIMDRAKLTAPLKQQFDEQLRQLSGAGYKVLAVARKEIPDWHGKLTSQMTNHLDLLGLVAVADTLRDSAKPAVAAARLAGIKVLMLTGDHVLTATEVARNAGIIEYPNQVLSGDILDTTPEADIPQVLANKTVLARMLPEHKYKILQAFRGREITAMTGDGVNDAPALVAADVGIALGTGTAVAKQAADMVLLDNNFATIIEAVKIGRGAYANIRKMVYYLLATNLGEVLTIIGALIVGLPLPVTAAQILWINLVTDGAVVIPLGLEPIEPRVLQQPPRQPREPLLDRKLFTRAMLVAGSMAMLTLIVFDSYSSSQGIAKAQTMAFAVLVVMQWANALSARRETAPIWKRIAPNPHLWLGLVIAAILQAIVMFGPLRENFSLALIGVQDLLILILPVAVILAVAEGHKLYHRRAN